MKTAIKPFLLAFVLPLTLVYAWWGGFNPVEFSETVRGPYRYAWIDHVGDYSKLPDIQQKVAVALEKQGIAHGLPITVLLDDPVRVPVTERRARAGYLVDPGVTVAAPLQVDEIPARRVLLLGVNAAHLLAPSRAYSRLDAVLSERGETIRMPTVELYEASDSALRMGRLSVEMPLERAHP
jgi:hypothetical protein